MKGTTRFILLAGLALSLLVNASGVTGTSFTDQEGSLDNVLRGWMPSIWVQTTQADFEAGVPINVDTSSSLGDVKLALASPIYDFSEVGTLTFSSGIKTRAAVIDTADGYAYFGTDNSPGKVVKVRLFETPYYSSGTIASQVLDTGAAGTSWDGLIWNETLQSNTDITFEVRASNTSFTKEAASPSWTAVGGTSPVTSGLPSGRYMQWRATLTTSDLNNNTPTLHEVTVVYTVASSNIWVQTTQADFEVGVLNQVDTSLSLGDVRLASISNWYNVDWGYRRVIIIDHTKVQDVADPSTAYADFPVLVYATGLSNIQANAADIRFTSSDGITELPREIEIYSSGTLYAWVKVTLTKDSSDSSDDVIYMYYGNDSVSEPAPDSTYGSENVWDSNYQAVWHLNETSGIHQDATSNTNDGTPEGGVIQNATGKIAGADGFDSLDDYVDCGNSASLNIRNAITLEAWINMNERPSADSWYNVFGKAEYFLYLAGIDETETLLAAYFEIDGEGADLWDEGVTDIGPSTWTYVVLTFDGTDIKGYVDGQHDWTKNKPGTIDDSSASDLLIGNYVGEDEYFNGIVDEARVSNVGRSDEWIKTCYNNQSAPSGFYIIGNEESPFVSSGSIASQVFDTGAAGTSWDELSWSETLQSNTDITFEVRASDTLFAKDDVSPSWTAVGGTSPVVAGLPSGRYIQWRATLTTSDPDNTPTLHEVIVCYE